MIIPTANVLLGFDKQRMLRFFAEGANYKSLVKEIEKGAKDVLLFNSESNPNFISFEHSLSNREVGFTISFIDPKQEFEKKYFSGGIFERIAGTAYSNDANAIGSDHLNEISDETKKSLVKYGKSFYSELSKELREASKDKVIYVSYGVGKNLKFWSGPHKTSLVGADIVPAGDGARKITLKLAPTPAPLDVGQRVGGFNEKVNLNLAGLTMRCVGKSQNIKFKDLPKTAYDPIQYLTKLNKITDQVVKYKSEEESLLSELKFENLITTIKEFDIHSIVVDAIRNYVQSATNNPNVIVLLPDINISCREHLTNLYQIYRYKSNADAIASAASIGSQAVFGRFASNMIRSTFKKTLSDFGKAEVYLAAVLDSFGLMLECKNLDKKDSIKVLPTPIVGQFINPVELAGKDPEESYKKIQNTSDFHAVLTEVSPKGLPDHMGKIRDVINKIKAASKGNYAVDFIVINETDIRLLDFWSKGNGKIIPSRYPTFAGYDDFRTDREAILVGDSGLIKEYLYGFVNLTEKEKSINDLKNRANSIQSDIQYLQEGGDYTKLLKTDPLVQGPQPAPSGEEISQGPQPFGPTFVPPEIFDSLTEEKTQTSLNILNSVPLHPLDKVILLNKTYNTSVNDLLKNKVTGAGPFGDVSYIPDEFAYKDNLFTKKEEELIKSSGIPVFRYNTQNPNILSMDVKISEVYLDMLKTGYSKIIARKASAVTRGLLPEGVGTFPISSKEEAVEYLRKKNFSTGLGNEERNRLVQDLMNKFDPEFTASFANGDPALAADTIVALLDSLEATSYKTFIEIGQHMPGNPTKVMTDIFYDLYSKCTDVSIKTLPTFHISYTSDVLNSLCVVFAQDIPILQGKKQEINILNNFMSGVYKIVGFKHVIDSAGCHSEFDLIRPTVGLRR